MTRLLIHLANACVLILIVVGVPNITSGRLGGLQLTSASKFQLLTVWGLGLAAGANFAAGLLVFRDKELRRACGKWGTVHAALGAIEWLAFSGYLQFGWLKEALLWVKQHTDRILRR